MHLMEPVTAVDLHALLATLEIVVMFVQITIVKAVPLKAVKYALEASELIKMEDAVLVKKGVILVARIPLIVMNVLKDILI